MRRCRFCQRYMAHGGVYTSEGDYWSCCPGLDGTNEAMRRAMDGRCWAFWSAGMTPENALEAWADNPGDAVMRMTWGPGSFIPRLGETLHRGA